MSYDRVFNIIPDLYRGNKALPRLHVILDDVEGTRHPIDIAIYDENDYSNVWLTAKEAEEFALTILSELHNIGALNYGV